MLLQAHQITLLSAMLEQWRDVKCHLNTSIQFLKNNGVNLDPHQGQMEQHTLQRAYFAFCQLSGRMKPHIPSEKQPRWRGGYERVSPWPSLLGSVAVLITYFVCARTRRHLGDCWLAGQSRGVKADTEVKVKNFLYVGQVSSQNPHFIHLLGWCNVHLGIRHDIILLLPFLYSFMFLPPFNSTISFCPHKDSLARQAASKRRKHREIKQMT